MIAEHDEGPERNARGFFVIGPQMVTPSDLLATLISETHCREPAPVPREARRAMRFYCGRTAAAKMRTALA